ncbi:Ig-like domain-containing protein [Vagococcus entomophilus]|uniref:Gram-positive cocci surface proteins LPxTG domain-containing protein n=1 Tax=Vagococcus entomophilus TaxID=1160095 RepID=A0A430AFT3_9ENTE|nr:Ig-like domain-containing protein [Vagococcus entomophilus]RSU06545.1 hypothetical protein CBF30_09870 [Vagococcus entomophilus]
MNKQKQLATLLIATAVLAGGATTTLVYNETVHAQTVKGKKNVSTKKVETQDDGNFDVTTGWELKDYTSTLDIPVEKVFLQNATRPKTEVHYASTNFFNIGDAHFLAEKHVKLKANRTYKIKLLYGMKLTGMKPDNQPDGKVNFNGDEKVATTNPLTDQVYQKTITTTKDQEFVISMEFHSNDSSGVFLMVGYDGADPEGGIIEESIPAPTVESPEAGTTLVKGKAIAGNRVQVIDQDNQLLGENIADSNGNFEVGANRALVYHEKVKVLQIDTEGAKSDATTTIVEDTTPPESPKITDIDEKDQMVSGTAEKNSTVSIYNQAKKLLGSGKASDQGVVNFHLDDTSAKAGDSLIAVAEDQAGNKSKETEVAVTSSGSSDTTSSSSTSDTTSSTSTSDTTSSTSTSDTTSSTSTSDTTSSTSTSDTTSSTSTSDTTSSTSTSDTTSSSSTSDTTSSTSTNSGESGGSGTVPTSSANNHSDSNHNGGASRKLPRTNEQSNYLLVTIGGILLASVAWIMSKLRKEQ